jgi:hypothetical protein
MADTKSYKKGLQAYLPTGPFWDLLLSRLHSWRVTGHWPNVRNPKRLNEFTLSQKLAFGGDLALAKRMTDKATMKEWLTENEYTDLVIPTRAILRTPEEFAAYVIPGDVVAKSTHGSGDVMILKDRSGQHLTAEEQTTMRTWMAEDFYLRCREPNYKGIPPGVIVEDMLKDANGDVPADVKIYCVKGHPYLVQIDLSRYSDHVQQMFTPEWEVIPASRFLRPDIPPVPRPEGLDRGLDIARAIASQFYLARIDLYLLSADDIRFGEITFFPHNGATVFEPSDGDLILGQHLRKVLAQT